MSFIDSGKDNALTGGRTHREKQYIDQCFELIEALREAVNLPETIELVAKETIDDLPDKIRQHYLPGYMAVAALHIETRKSDNVSPRTVKQLATALETTLEAQTHLSSDNNHLNKARRAAKRLKKYDDADITPELSKDYLPYILDVLDLDDQVRDEAWTILEKITGHHELQAKSKIGIASAVTYLAAEHHSSDDVSLSQLREISCREKKTIRETTRTIQTILEDGD